MADACADAGIRFVLGHALYLKAIDGGKNKSDRIDSEKLAHLLRSNLILPAYVYPRERRLVRNLLRRRTSFVWNPPLMPAQDKTEPWTIGSGLRETENRPFP